MATQIVMDHTGDRRHQFDPQNADGLAEAEKRFKELTGMGFTAATRTTAGEIHQGRFFRPDRSGNSVFSSPCRRLSRTYGPLASNLAWVARPAPLSRDPPALQNCQ